MVTQRVNLFVFALFASLACFVLLQWGEASPQQSTMPKSLIDGGEADKPAPKQKPPKPAATPSPAKPRPPKKVKSKDSEEALTPVPAPAPAPGPTGGPMAEVGYSLTYTENFSTSNHGWAEKETQDIRLQRKSGAYCMYHKRTEGSWLVYKSIGFRPDDDFILEATIKKVSGPLNFGFGLLWGLNSDPLTNYRYLISGNGKYSIQKEIGGKQVDIIIDWSPCPVIRQGNGATNVLKIHRVGSTIYFYMNGSFVTTTKYERPSHAKVGFIVMRNQEIEINKITLKTKLP